MAQSIPCWLLGALLIVDNVEISVAFSLRALLVSWFLKFTRSVTIHGKHAWSKVNSEVATPILFTHLTIRKAWSDCFFLGNSESPPQNYTHIWRSKKMIRGRLSKNKVCTPIQLSFISSIITLDLLHVGLQSAVPISACHSFPASSDFHRGQQVFSVSHCQDFLSHTRFSAVSMFIFASISPYHVVVILPGKCRWTPPPPLPFFQCKSWKIWQNLVTQVLFIQMSIIFSSGIYNHRTRIIFITVSGVWQGTIIKKVGWFFFFGGIGKCE